MAHLWARWLHQPCRLGDPLRFTGGDKIRIGQLVGKMATSPLPPRGSPPLQVRGQNWKWPHCGRGGYITPAASGIPTASQGVTKSELANLWARWLHHPWHLGDPLRFKAGDKLRSGPLVGNVATSPLPPPGSPPLQSGGKNQKWPTCGQGGYVTPAASGIPSASERGAKSEVAHLWARWLRYPCRPGDPLRLNAGDKIRVAQLWARWLHHPCRLGDRLHFKAGDKIRSGPLVGKVATSPLPPRGSPPPQSGRQNQKWPTCEQGGYVPPAASGIPYASKRGTKSEVAHLLARWLHHPCRLGDPLRFKAGDKIRSGPIVGKVATSPLPPSGIPSASKRGTKSEVANLWARWLRNPCRLGDPLHLTTGGKIRGGPLVGKVATQHLPPPGSPPPQSGGQNRKWPNCGQGGYITPAASGIPSATERGAKSEVAHLWARWLHQPCRLGDPLRFKAGDEIGSGPIVGKVATSPLPPRESPSASERGAKSEVAQLWARWLHHPCRLGDPLRFKAGDKIRSDPLVSKVATSPLPLRGSPPL